MPEGVNQAMLSSIASAGDVPEDSLEPEELDSSIKATGKQKKILGYTCNQYLFSSPDTNGEIWVAEDLDLQNYNFMSYWQQMSRKNPNQGPEDWGKMKDGFVLEFKMQDKDGRESTLTATGIDDNAKAEYDMKKYQIMDMSGMDGLMGK